MRWPEGPPHLAPKPSLFIISFLLGGFVFSFLLFAFNTKAGFPPRKGHFCLFLSLSFCFSLAFLGLPLFQFLFLCLSPVLFLFLFLLVFLLLSFGSFFFASFFPFVSSLLLFHERNNIKRNNCNVFFHHFFLFFFGFLSDLFLSNPFFLIFVLFLILSYVFCST